MNVSTPCTSAAVPFGLRRIEHMQRPEPILSRALEDPRRLIQAMKLWKLGVGRELGVASLEAYLITIPQIPGHLIVDDKEFPYLVLVDPRIGLVKLCALAAVGIGDMKEELLAQRDRKYDEFTTPVWVRIQNGEKCHGRDVKRCEQDFFAHGEVGLTALQAVCAVAQYPGIVGGVVVGTATTHVMELPGTQYDGKQMFYLQRMNDQLSLGWWWFSGHNSAGCASRRK